MEMQRAEEARKQAEVEAQRAAEEERVRLEQERKAAIEKQKREIAEQYLRSEQLQNCINGIAGIKAYNRKEDLKEKEQMEVNFGNKNGMHFFLAKMFRSK